MQSEVFHNRIAQHQARAFSRKWDGNHCYLFPQKPQLSFRFQSALRRRLSLPPPPNRKSNSSFQMPPFSSTSADDPTHIRCLDSILEPNADSSTRFVIRLIVPLNSEAP